VTKAPSLPFYKIIKALQRDGWIVVRQKGSHIRLHKKTESETLKLTVSVHTPVKRTTLAHILKQSKIKLKDFLKLL
jgi:predicted RNA binding protein YcfA (HicA-like mRNA interferase family)